MSYDSNDEELKGRRTGFFTRLFCEHAWERFGSGYDSYVQCLKCETAREERPGDVAPW